MLGNAREEIGEMILQAAKERTISRGRRKL
jgi:hypothetical protein